jgi:hypothetical protein
MLKNLSEKYKFYLLVAGLIILLVISYQVALKGTFQCIKNCRTLKEKAKTAAQMPQKVANLKKELNSLNGQYFDNIHSQNDAHEVILEKLSLLSSKYSTSVTGYPERHIFQTSFIQTETHTAILHGGFINLLHVLYQIEANERVGRIASVEYYTVIDYKTKITNLYSRIYIQNFRNLKKDETK